MANLILRRFAAAIPVLLIIMSLSFVMMRLAPGNPFADTRRLSPAIERNVMARYGMDRSLVEQYLTYMGGLLRGDLGPSLKYPDQSVVVIIGESFPKSALLGGLALLLALSLGLGLGVISALRREDWFSRLLSIGVLILICVPAFVSAPLLVLVLAAHLGWLPMGGWGGASHLVLPVIVLAMPHIAIIMRMTRAEMKFVMQADFIRSARARGLPPSRIVLRHALPVAVAPVVSYLGPTCAALLAGSLVVEQIFGLPGLGRHFVNAALQRDYPLVMGVVILYSGLTLACNLLVDVVHLAIAPGGRAA